MPSQDSGNSGALGKTLLGTGGGAGGAALLMYLLAQGGIIGGTGSAEKMVSHMGNEAIHASRSVREGELDRAVNPVVKTLDEIVEDIDDLRLQLNGIALSIAHGQGASGVSLGD